MAIDPATLKLALKVVTSAASDEKTRQVILLACLVPFIVVLLVLSSPFAIFFSIIGDGTNNDSVSVMDAMFELKEAFVEKIQIEQNDPLVDEIHTIIMGSEDNSIIDNSSDVLIVFAAKYNVIDEDAEQLALLTEKQVEKLRKVFWNMNTIYSEIESKSEKVTHTTTDGKGNTIKETKTITTKIKTIYVDCLSADEMASFYNFNSVQIRVMDEMKKSGLGLLVSNNVNMYLSKVQIEEIKSFIPEGMTIDRSEMVEIAKSIVGKVHYFWGGKSNAITWDNRWGKTQEVTSLGSSTTGTQRPFGLDCSGYVSWVFINTGLPIETIGHGTTAQWNASSSIPENSVMPGDLAFLAAPGTRKVNHIGIVVSKEANGNILVAHCSSGANNVVITTAESVGFLYYRRPAVFIE